LTTKKWPRKANFFCPKIATSLADLSPSSETNNRRTEETMRHFLGIRFLGKNRGKSRQKFVELIVSALRQTIWYAKGERPLPLEAFLRLRVATIFEEASTRTRTSFEESARNLGMILLNGINVASSSLAKNESLVDTILMLAQYGVWGAVIRTKTEGAGVMLASEIQRLSTARNWVPQGISVVIGGEGTKEHPSQCLLDAVTIVLNELGMRDLDQYGVLEELFNQPDAEARVSDRVERILDNIKIAFVGDLKYSRVVHSWVKLGDYFDIEYLFVSPEEFALESCFLPEKSSVSRDLKDALDWDYVYFGRAQIERLTGTAEHPGTMTKRQAYDLMERYQVDEHFLNACRGKLMHAQPRDGYLPMIPDRFKDHPKVIMLQQSAVGIPTREAIWKECYADRFSQEPIIEIPQFALRDDMIKKHAPWEQHYSELLAKMQGRESIVQPIRNGTVVDRLKCEMTMIHLMMLERDGVFQQTSGKQVIPGLKLDSPYMGRKGALWAYGYNVGHVLAAKHGLISPHVRFSCMHADDPDNPDYMRIEYDLPSHVEGFSCLNDNCISRRGECTSTSYEVSGKKGEATPDGYANAGLSCIYCESKYTAREVVVHDFGQFVVNI